MFAVMILETLRGGELFYHIKKCGKLTPETSRYYFKQLAEAVKHLITSGYCHRDVKPWNIMMNNDLS